MGPTDAEGDAMGEARLKTKEYIEKAAHGVLFADEAHTLVMDRQNMYGKQVASELMNCLQTPLAEGGCIVVFAGYPGGMKTLLQSDPDFTAAFRCSTASRWPTTQRTNSRKSSGRWS